MGLTISCCEHLCDYIHHSRDSPETTLAHPGRWSVGQRGLPCPFLYIITQVLSAHATCWLVSWPLFRLTSSRTTWNMTCSWRAKGARIAPRGRWLLERVRVRLEAKAEFWKAGGATTVKCSRRTRKRGEEQWICTVAEMAGGCCWRMMWNSCSLTLTSTRITETGPCRRHTSMHVSTPLPFCLSESMIQPLLSAP